MDFLVIDDDRTFCEAVCLLIEEEGHYVESVATPEVALDRLGTGRFDAALLDLHLGRHNGLTILPEIVKLRPNLPVVMFSADGTVKSAVEALEHGAMDFLEKPFTREQFHVVFACIRRFTEMSRKIERLEEEMKEVEARAPDAMVDFEVPVMRTQREILRRAAKSPAAVLLAGENGTGKNAAARLMHAESDLAAKPFVVVSCRAVSKDLLESRLFGQVRDASSGVFTDQWGRVKAAEGGTLFFDEIGDLPPETQPKLLRLLQEHEYERVGESVTRFADVRIIAATSCDLKKRVAEGTFREDLFYRLNVITVELPALRTRPADILTLAEHYLQQCVARVGRPITGFTAECALLLQHYAWPGNLRELHNVVERAVMLCTGTQLDAIDLPLEIRQASEAGERYPDIGSMMSLARLEELHIRHLLAHCPNLADAAHVLGIDPATLYRKRKRMGLGRNIGGKTFAGISAQN